MQIPFLTRQADSKRGAPPGSLIFVGDRSDLQTTIEQIDYSDEQLTETDLEGFPKREQFASPGSVTWVNVHGVHDPDMVECIGKELGTPRLLLEDLMNTKHRPKIEEESDYMFVILKMLSMQDDRLKVEQVSLIVGQNYVISLQEVEGDVFDPIRERIRTHKGQIRKLGADYLAFALMDAVIDNYFVVLEYLGERMENIERKLMTEPDHDQIRDIHTNKMDLFFMRKAIWPLREIANHLDKDSAFVTDASRPYYRDLYDHVIQAIDTVETFRDIASGITDLYMSIMGNKMNEVMKVLTIIATIFIPITFIAGIYGMNFEFMPELKWKGSYFVVWGVMLAVTFGMLAYFRKKRWL